MIARWLPITLLLLVSCEKEMVTEAIRPVKAVQVSESAVAANQVVFPGSLRAFKRADLSFRVDGIVIARDITVGQKSKKGTLLMQLDPREYEIALQKSKGKIESLQAQLDFASRDFTRMKRIYETDPGAISLSLLDRKRETNNQLIAELSIAQRDFDKSADDLSYTFLKAPFDGIIAAIYVENHEQVRAKQPVLRFLDTNEREMEINVPEKYITTLLEEEPNLHFEVKLNAFPDKVFPASIKEIGTEASSLTLTYPVTLLLHETPNEPVLLAGMIGNATLTLPSSSHRALTFKVPRSAIFSLDLEGSHVWVVDPTSQTVHKKAVQLEENRNENEAIIKEGVLPGDWIVIAGTSFLSEGQKVKLVAEPSKP